MDAFQEPFRWLLLNLSNLDLLVNLPLYLDSHIYITYKKIDNYHVKGFYRTTNGSIVQEDIGVWSNETSFEYFRRIIIGETRRNLQEFTMFISFVITHNDTLNHLWDYRCFFLFFVFILIDDFSFSFC